MEVTIITCLSCGKTQEKKLTNVTLTMITMATSSALFERLIADGTITGNPSGMDMREKMKGDLTIDSEKKHIRLQLCEECASKLLHKVDGVINIYYQTIIDFIVSPKPSAKDRDSGISVNELSMEDK